MAITSKHTFGWQKETELQTRLEQMFDTPLIKNTNRFNRFDFETDEYLIELKSRQAPIKPETYDTWMLPVCKTHNLTKHLVIFYYFEQDNSLWYIFYDEDLFKDFRVIKNFNNQPTFLIPYSYWTKVEQEEEGVVA